MPEIDAAAHRALHVMLTKAKAQEPPAEAFDVQAWLDAVSPPPPPRRCIAAMTEPCTAPLHVTLSRIAWSRVGPPRDD